MVGVENIYRWTYLARPSGARHAVSLRPGLQTSLCLFTSLMVNFGLPVAAQPLVNAQAATPAALGSAFQRMFVEPNNVDSRYAYAQLQSEAKNYEAAIAALEGLLVAPDAPASVRVELGVLYFRLASYGMCESYLRQAIEDPRLDERLRRQAQDLLPEAVRRNAKSQTTGRLVASVRWRDNPLDVPATGVVLQNAQPIALPPTIKRTSRDLVLFGRVDRMDDLDRQDELRVESSAAFAASGAQHYDRSGLQAHQQPDETLDLQGSLGVRFKPSPAYYRNLRVKPYLTMGHELRGGSTYFSGKGIGIETQLRSSNALTFTGGLSAVRYDYSERVDKPGSELESGWLRELEAGVNSEFLPGRFGAASFGWIDKSARSESLAYSGAKFKGGLATSYASPVSWSDRHWTSSVELMVWCRRYRQADPLVLQNVARSDTEKKLSVLTTIPTSKNLSFQVQFDVVSNESNIQYYAHNNRTAYVNALWQF